MIAGERVAHPTYGAGTVAHADARGMSVDLDTGEMIACSRFALESWAPIAGAR